MIDARLAAQCISAPLSRPVEVVARLGAVQAQDYAGGLWAVGLRLARAREADVERALADGTIVRTWPMRGTLHFVAAEDVRWMLELLSARTVARAAGTLRKLGLDRATLSRAARILERALRGGRRLTRAAAYQELERGGIATGAMRGVHILWWLAHQALICCGPREGKQQTIVLLDEWVAGGPPKLARDEALERLARRYFISHGPATAADFAWWAGLTQAEATRAAESSGDALAHEEIDGRRYWRAPSLPRASRRPRTVLLPPFDELLVAYADRAAMIDEAHSAKAGGLLSPTILAGRRIVGTWRRTLASGKVAFTPALFEEPGAPGQRALAAALRKYAAFLGAAVRALPP